MLAFGIHSIARDCFVIVTRRPRRWNKLQRRGTSFEDANPLRKQGAGHNSRSCRHATGWLANERFPGGGRFRFEIWFGPGLYRFVTLIRRASVPPAFPLALTV